MVLELLCLLVLLLLMALALPLMVLALMSLLHQLSMEHTVLSLECQHAARIASHQGVLENAPRGRGERRENQPRESTGERSRRNERPGRRSDTRNSRSTEAEPKKPTLDHEPEGESAAPADIKDNGNNGSGYQVDREDELMGARGPPVYDLSQQDGDESGEDRSNEIGQTTGQHGAGLGPYKVFGNVGGGWYSCTHAQPCTCSAHPLCSPCPTTGDRPTTMDFRPTRFHGNPAPETRQNTC